MDCPIVNISKTMLCQKPFLSSISTQKGFWINLFRHFLQWWLQERLTVLLINLREIMQQLRLFRGKRLARATREVRIWTEDVPTIILHALALQRFMVAGRGFRQAHGSAMGSPLSPVLCGMVIAAQEEIWRRTFSITCSSMSRNLLSLRYVDNRLWISNAGSNNCLVSNCS